MAKKPICASVRWITEYGFLHCAHFANACFQTAAPHHCITGTSWRFAYLPCFKQIAAALKTPGESGLKIVP
jgi:hypothetical protein